MYHTLLSVHLCQNKALHTRMAVRTYEQPTTFRLIDMGPDETSELEEVVMRVQGILCAKDLPPITNRPR